MKLALGLLTGVLLLSCNLADDGLDGEDEHNPAIRAGDSRASQGLPTLQVEKRPLDWLKKDGYEVKAADDLSLFGFPDGKGKIKVYSSSGELKQDISAPTSTKIRSFPYIIWLSDDLIITSNEKEGTFVWSQEQDWTEVSSKYFESVLPAEQGYFWLQGWDWQPSDRARLDVNTLKITPITQKAYEEKMTKEMGADLLPEGGFRKGSYNFRWGGRLVDGPYLSDQKINTLVSANGFFESTFFSGQNYFLVASREKNLWGGPLERGGISIRRFHTDGRKPLALPLEANDSMSTSTDTRTVAAYVRRENEIELWREGYALKTLSSGYVTNVQLSSDGNTLWATWDESKHTLYHITSQ